LVTAELKEADAPAQIEFPPLIVIVADAGVVTVMLIVLDVTFVDETQFAFDVKTQLITSPLFNVLVEKVVLFVPTFEPFTFH
jgi:hypothetical protein